MFYLPPQDNESEFKYFGSFEDHLYVLCCNIIVMCNRCVEQKEERKREEEEQRRLQEEEIRKQQVEIEKQKEEEMKKEVWTNETKALPLIYDNMNSFVLYSKYALSKPQVLICFH